MRFGTAYFVKGTFVWSEIYCGFELWVSIEGRLTWLDLDSLSGNTVKRPDFKVRLLTLYIHFSLDWHIPF